MVFSISLHKFRWGYFHVHDLSSSNIFYASLSSFSLSFHKSLQYLGFFSDYFSWILQNFNDVFVFLFLLQVIIWLFSIFLLPFSYWRRPYLQIFVCNIFLVLKSKWFPCNHSDEFVEEFLSVDNELFRGGHQCESRKVLAELDGIGVFFIKVLIEYAVARPNN